MKELSTVGFIRIEDFLDKPDIEHMIGVVRDWKDEYYTEELIKGRISYLSDSSETRVSNAYMVSTGHSPLPHIDVEDSVVKNLIDDYQFLLEQLSANNKSSSYAAIDTRLMLNMQEYMEKSKPIPWHFDGEYLDLNTEDTKGNVMVKEAVVARYVGVYTLYNENKFGTRVKNLRTGEVSDIESEPGDFFLFDNTSFLHMVPELDKPRSMFGFRNFDFNPVRLSQTYSKDSFVINNECFGGYSKSITTEEAEILLEEFNQKWFYNYSDKMEAKF